MTETSPLAGKTVFITGGSRGIGASIAVTLAKAGANIVVAAKTSDPHPKLPGTIHTTIADVEDAGGNGLAIQLDIRDEDAVAAAVEQTVDHFGGLDIVVNNASAIRLVGTEQLAPKRYDLLHQINGRGTFVTVQAALPHLKKSDHGRVLTLSPPISLDPKWYGHFGPYVITKLTMSLFTLAWSQEFKDSGIAFSALWPRTAIATAAVEHEIGGEDMLNMCRTPQIVADAAEIILAEDAALTNGRFFLDDEVLLTAGDRDLSKYDVKPGNPLLADFMVEPLPGLHGIPVQ